MTRGAGRLLLIWLGMLLLLGLETAVTLLLPGRFAPAGVLVLGMLMVAAVGVVFMRLRAGPGLSRAFVLAALFWLAVLLGVGSMDPFTRTDYPLPVTRYP